MVIFYYIDEWMHGPLNEDELSAKLLAGEISARTPVWLQSGDKWISANLVEQLAEQSSDETPNMDPAKAIAPEIPENMPSPRCFYALRLATDQELITIQQAKRCLTEIFSNPASANDVPGLLHTNGWITSSQRSSLSSLTNANPDQDILAGYELLEMLGSGSMGATYKARQISLDRILALKVLLPRFSQDPDYIKRFMREARLAAKLNHENIATAYEVGSCSGRYFLAMELVEGITLSNHIKKNGRLEEDKAVAIIIPICYALQYAHEIGIIHRDISPRNIIVKENGKPKLIDMGLAKNITSQNSDDTETAVGTPAYLSPEQALGRKNVDIRTDIYSLGCVFYEMLVGTPPFSGESALETISKHLNEDIPKLNTEISPIVRRVVQKMTQRDPLRRYSEPFMIIDDLEAALEFSQENKIPDIPPISEQLQNWEGVKPTEILLPCDWREYVHLISQEVDNKLEESNVDPEFQGYVQTILTELVANAFDHGSQENGVIRIRLELNKAFFRIEVEDNGEGFAANEMLHKLRNAPVDRERQRGIIQVLQIADILEYNQKGNKVKAVIYRKSKGSGLFEENRDGIHFVEVKGKGDMALTELFRRWADSFEVADTKAVCLMVRTDWVSSMFVGSIAKIQSKLEEENVYLAIWVERPSCRRIMHQLGLTSFIDIHSSFEKAVTAVKAHAK